MQICSYIFNSSKISSGLLKNAIEHSCELSDRACRAYSQARKFNLEWAQYNWSKQRELFLIGHEIKCS